MILATATVSRQPRALLWWTAVLITAAALAVEGLILGARPAAAAILEISQSRLFWEALHSAVYFSFFALLLPRTMREGFLPLRVLLAGFSLQILTACAFRLAIPEAHAIPCLHVGDMILLLILSRPWKEPDARPSIAALAAVAALVVGTERHGWEDVLLGAASGLAIGTALSLELPALIRARLSRHERPATGVLLAMVLTVCFYATDFMMSRAFARGEPFWSPASSWDARIPFMPEWVWAYFLYFPFCFAPLLCRRLWDDLRSFRGAAAGFALQFAAALAVFWLFPSRMERPDFDPAGPSRWALSLLYRVDRGFNVFPSLHVANSVYVACLIGRWAGGYPRAAAWAACAAISLSTLFVKQHYLLDLPAGALLGLACYRLAFPPGPSFSQERRVRRIAVEYVEQRL